MSGRLPTLDLREMRGESIAREFGSIRRVDETTYKVKSQSGNFEYYVVQGEMGWLCSCPDAMYRNLECKHIHAVKFSFKLRELVGKAITIAPVNVQACPACNSESIVRHGLRHNASGDIQRFSCKACGKWFVVNLGFEKMHATPQVITSAMQLYFTGESLRSVQKFLRLQGVNVSHVAIYKWIRKYVKLMHEYLDKITPQLSDTWRADEIYIKVKGDMKYLFAMMDDQTRFWIASQISPTKYTADIVPLFQEGRRVAGKRPLALITDGGNHFKEPFRKEFYTLKYPRTKHIRDIRFDGSVHNNKMERLNGEIRDREKTFRGLKKTDSPFFNGYRLYHNYVRPHEALKGETPADRVGIKVEGDNKWITLIQNASRNPLFNRSVGETSEETK